MDSSAAKGDKRQNNIKKPAEVEYDSDIDPDDLLPVYLDCKTKLFHLEVSKPRSTPHGTMCTGGKKNAPKQATLMKPDPFMAKLIRKVKKIEDDILFDQYIANQQWEPLRIQLERDASAQRHAAETEADSKESPELDRTVDSDDEVSREAAKMGAAILEEGSDDDAALADLFASLPVNEVDPLTGKSTTVVNGSNGVKVTIRDFGKWTGVSPTRVLEEACRAR